MLRSLCALAFCLFATNAAAQSFNGQEQAEIRAIVRDYLVHNPDVLREALDAVQARANAERRVRIENDRRDFSVGPANAPITIVEFYDYRCPYCHADCAPGQDGCRTLEPQLLGLAAYWGSKISEQALAGIGVATSAASVLAVLMPPWT